MVRKIKEKSGFGKVIKRNQVIVFTLALMLMTAGYMNYTNNQGNENILLAQLGDAQLVSANITASNDETNEFENSLESEETNINTANNITETDNDIEDESDDNEEEENEDNDEEDEEEESEDTAETSTSVDTSYFTQSKLERDTMYSQMLETYTAILENANISSDQKGIAEAEIKNINDTKNAIMIAENLLQTKGFENIVVFVNSDSVSVVVGVESLQTEQVAQIQNIIERELNVEIENIHISFTK